jgi:hypothetical protein
MNCFYILYFVFDIINWSSAKTRVVYVDGDGDIGRKIRIC